MDKTNIDSKHNQQEEIAFNPDALAEKYLLERDKRLRQDANDQYLEVKGDFSYFVEGVRMFFLYNFSNYVF